MHGLLFSYGSFIIYVIFSFCHWLSWIFFSALFQALTERQFYSLEKKNHWGKHRDLMVMSIWRHRVHLSKWSRRLIVHPCWRKEKKGSVEGELRGTCEFRVEWRTLPLRLERMAALVRKQQGCGLLRVLLLLLGVSVVCTAALGTGSHRMDHRNHKHRHLGIVPNLFFTCGFDAKK